MCMYFCTDTSHAVNLRYTRRIFIFFFFFFFFLFLFFFFFYIFALLFSSPPCIFPTFSSYSNFSTSNPSLPLPLPSPLRLLLFFSPPFFASSLSNTSSPLSSAATTPPLCLKIVHHFRKGQPGCRHRDATVAATLHTAVVIGVRLVTGITNHVHLIGLRDGWTASRPVGVHGACSGTSGGGRAE